MTALPAESRRGITYEIVRFQDILVEGSRHAEAHWKEFGLHQDIRTFGMDYSKYLAASASGKLLSCVARKDGVMAGYLMMFVVPDTHAKGSHMAESAFYYTVPHPMRGLVLRGMIRTTVRHLLDKGVRYIRFRHRLQQTARPILENLGFELDELSYSLNVEKFRG